jgi:short-subunit dehydrogenase
VLGARPRENPACGPAWVQADLTHAADIARVAARPPGARQRVVHAAGVPAFGAAATPAAGADGRACCSQPAGADALTQALLPALLRQPRRSMVFVGSALGRIGVPGFSVYGASKAGLHGFAEALRRELADTPVRVQILGPRSTRTGFNDAASRGLQPATGTAMDTPSAWPQALLALIESEAAERFVGFPERLAVRLNGAARRLAGRQLLAPPPQRAAPDPHQRNPT